MQVRIRCNYRPFLDATSLLFRDVALFTATLLTPAAFVAYVLGLWRVTADLRLTGAFAISDGLFSHWQVWAAVGIVLHGGSITLLRLGREEKAERAGRPGEPHVTLEKL